MASEGCLQRHAIIGMLLLLAATTAAAATNSSSSTCFQTTVQRNDTTIVAVLDRVNDKYPNATFVELCFANNLTTLPGCLLPSPGTVLKYNCEPLKLPSNATWAAFLDQAEASLANGTAGLRLALGSAAVKLSDDDLMDLAYALDSTLGFNTLDEPSSSLAASTDIDQPTAAKVIGYGRQCNFGEHCCHTVRDSWCCIFWSRIYYDRCDNPCVSVDGYWYCDH